MTGNVCDAVCETAAPCPTKTARPPTEAIADVQNYADSRRIAIDKARPITCVRRRIERIGFKGRLTMPIPFHNPLRLETSARNADTKSARPREQFDSLHNLPRANTRSTFVSINLISIPRKS